MNYNLQILAATEKRLSNTLETLEETRSQLATLKKERDELAEWKRVIEEYCIVDWIPMTTPEKTIMSLLEWNIKMALDPKISQAAHDLVANSSLREAAQDLLDYFSVDDIELAREVWGNTNTRLVLEYRAKLVEELEKS